MQAAVIENLDDCKLGLDLLRLRRHDLLPSPGGVPREQAVSLLGESPSILTDLGMRPLIERALQDLPVQRHRLLDTIQFSADRGKKETV